MKILLKEDYIFDCVPEVCYGTNECSHKIEFELDVKMKRSPMKQTVHWIYADPKHEQGDVKDNSEHAEKIFVVFDFPQLLQSAMGPGRGWDEKDRPGARKKNIHSFKKTLKDLMDCWEFKQFEKSVLFLQFPNRDDKNTLSALIRKKIEKVEQESQDKVWSSSSGGESEA